MDLQKAAQPVAAISIAARQELELVEQHHSCILAAAALTEVLRRRGYGSAYALTVEAKIYNPTFTAWIKQNGVPKDQAALERCEAAGGAQVGIGTNRPNDLHVAVIVPGVFGERHAMVDVTIIQANQRNWQIELMSVLSPVSEAFVREEASFKPELNGCLIVYNAFPQDLAFENSEIWTNKVPHNILADRIMSRF